MPLSKSVTYVLVLAVTYVVELFCYLCPGCAPARSLACFGWLVSRSTLASGGMGIPSSRVALRRDKWWACEVWMLACIHTASGFSEIRRDRRRRRCVPSPVYAKASVFATREARLLRRDESPRQAGTPTRHGSLNIAAAWILVKRWPGMSFPTPGRNMWICSLQQRSDLERR